MRRLLLSAFLALSFTACSDDDDPTPPSGNTDAGVDAGTDGGTTDSGTEDGGSTDGGTGDGGSDGGTSTGSSGGSGKLPCDSTGTVTQNNQTYTYCVAKVAGTELKLVEPRVGIIASPMHLAIYLHGDGARAHTGNTAPRLQAPWAFENQTLYISALAPNKCAWWTKPSVTNCAVEGTAADRDLDGDNAKALVEIIDTVRKRWDIIDEPILFGGSSGGSVFLTASFLPRYGDRYRGVYALGCGGEAPWADKLEWDSTNPALRGSTRLFYTFGDQDEYITDIRASITAFRAYAFPLTESVIAGAAHCAFDHIGGVKDIWAAELAK
ncbi:hypothetical protein LZ198_34405 [Myxococcus sp. K15C18031901]|uniref:alpha/beta hydrolase n=1 Tax=Myxococcus dinghuensis TaxID=2906761 RepID=UPI0020A81FF2|nr:hypothetical protein [Myxococcus dinghuensis]MCP3103978.1 hypothetical protein [Myxococcus dinghuensis]